MPEVPYNPFPQSVGADFTPRQAAGPMSISVPDMTGPGRALQNIGQAIDKAGTVAADIALRNQNLVNASTENDLYVKAAIKLGDLENDLHQLQGANANGDALKNFSEASQKIIQDAIEAAPNDFVRRRLQMQLSNRLAIAIPRAGDYIGGKARQHANDTANARIGLGISEASSDDPGKFIEGLAGAEQTVKETGERLGWSPEEIEKKRNDVVGEAWAGHLGSLSIRSPETALKVFEANKEKIPEGVRTKIQDKLLTNITTYAPKIISDKVMQPGLPSAGGTWAPETVDYLQQRAGSRDVTKLDPVFGDRLAGAIKAAEEATGSKAKFTSLYRPPEVQAQLRANFTGQPVVWDGVTYNPQPGVKQGPAAAPGASRHQRGLAADLQEGPVLDWLRSHPEVTSKFGLEFLSGKTGRDDPGHIQLANGQGLTRGELNNNFTNLTVSPRTKSYGGYLGDDGRFARYATPEDGLRAADQNLQWYKSQGKTTVESIISTWAPANENDTPALIKSMSERLGVDPKAELPMDDPEFRAKLISGLIQQETGKKPYTPEQIKQAITSTGRVGASLSLKEAQEQAQRQAEALLPESKYGSYAVTLRDQATQSVATRYNVTRGQQRDIDLQNSKVLLGALYGDEDTPVRSVEELMTKPEAKKAYDELVKSDPSWAKKVPQYIQQMNRLDANNDTEARAQKYQELSGMMALDPQAFMKENLVEADLTNRARNELLKEQKKMKATAEADPAIKTAMNDLISRGLFKDVPGFKTSNTTTARQFAGQLYLEMKAFQRQTGKEPDNEWVQKKATELLKVQAATGLAAWNPFANDVRAFQVQPPADEKKKIEEALAAKGYPVTPDLVQYYWRKKSEGANK